MLFTKKTEYALLSLISIAKSDEPKKVDDLANELAIPKAYLAKILQAFSKKDVLLSYKGASGGFSLKTDPSKITIYDIATISEDKTPAVFECSSSLESCPSNIGINCQIWPVLNKLQLKIDNFLNNITLKELM